jgi:hypothetical protein
MFQTLSGKRIGAHDKNCWIMGLCDTFSSSRVGRKSAAIGGDFLPAAVDLEMVSGTFFPARC